MKIRFSTFWFLLFFVLPAIQAQQYLVVEKTGTAKNFKYSPGNKIDLLVNETRLQGTITQLTDSTLTLDYSIIVQLEQIKKVYRFRGFVYRFSKTALLMGGMAYIAIVGANGIINNEYPLVDQTTAIIGVSMIAASFLLRPLYYRKIPVDGRWQLKVINFDALNYSSLPDDLQENR
jgi:hypothetical protein